MIFIYFGMIIKNIGDYMFKFKTILFLSIWIGELFCILNNITDKVKLLATQEWYAKMLSLKVNLPNEYAVMGGDYLVFTFLLLISMLVAVIITTFLSWLIYKTSERFSS